MTIIEAAAAWLEHLATQGLKDGTVDVYGRDVAKLVEFFGGDKDLTSITVLKMNGFLRSNLLTKKSNGKPLAAPTLARSRRACRMFLAWCASAGHATELPAGVINVLKG